MTDPELAPARRDDVTSVELDGETVVYADGTIHKLDRIATLLWDAFDGATTLNEFADDFAEVYAEDRQKILADIVQCVATLERHNLLATD